MELKFGLPQAVRNANLASIVPGGIEIQYGAGRVAERMGLQSYRVELKCYNRYLAMLALARLQSYRVELKCNEAQQPKPDVLASIVPGGIEIFLPAAAVATGAALQSYRVELK